MAKDLLLELYSEEIPASSQIDAEKGFAEIFRKNFTAAGIRFGEVVIHSGPCRVVVIIHDIEELIEAKTTEKRGPKVDSPREVVESFAKSVNKVPEELSQLEVKGNLYYFYIEKWAQRLVREILPEVISVSLSEYVWPKSMYWGDYKISWIRPLRNILCLFGEEILPVKYGHLSANNFSFGHKFMDFRKIEILNLDDYFKKLDQAKVVVRRSDRKKMIEDSIAELCASENLLFSFDYHLLDEVVGLVEYPNTLMGLIPDKFMDIPSEILVSAMKQHQKYFTLQDVSGNLSPKFIFVSNITSSDDSNIVAGNEKVLTARLADAAFFYNEDLGKTLDEMYGLLSRVTFHAKLGSQQQKADRMFRIAGYLSGGKESVMIAAKLAKADLVSGVVGEFAELQGVMGGYYALKKYDSSISFMIANHYKPFGAKDQVAEGDAAFVSLADKLDSLVGLYLAGERATGSKDPYGLRRYALGIIRVILHNRLHINLRKIIANVIDLYEEFSQSEAVLDEILTFIEDRARNFMLTDKNRKILSSVVNFAVDDDILILQDKLKAIENFIESKKGQALVLSYKRANNILSQEQSKRKMVFDNYDILHDVSNSFERDLLIALNDVIGVVNDSLHAKSYSIALAELSKLNQPLEQFFANLLIIDEDEVGTARRLTILNKLVMIFSKFANFNELQE
jgi:glycyl-tRNA synthetase beta chain